MKRFLFIFSVLMMFTMTSYAQTEIEFFENNIYIEGCLTKAVDEINSVYVLMEKDGDVDYINSFPISSNGNYQAKFKFLPDGGIEDYDLKIKAGSEDVTSSLKIATSQKEPMSFEIVLNNADGKSYIDENEVITISANIENYFSDGGNHVMLAASYDEKGKLIDVQTKDFVVDYSIRNQVESWTFDAKSAATVKAFAFDSVSTINPLTKAVEITEKTYGADRLADTNNEITALFLGDSLYQGTGATSLSNNHVSLVGDHLRTKYSKVNAINAGIGGTNSLQGLYRVQKDVAAYNPDIVFVDFACNDRFFDEITYKQNMETIVRELIRLPHQPVIVFEFPACTFTNNSVVSDSDTNYPQNKEWQKQVADYYGVTVVDFHAFIKSKIDNNEIASWESFKSQYTTDGVHLNDAGYKMWSDYTWECIKDNLDSKYELKAFSGEYQYSNPRLIAAIDENAVYSGSWKCDKTTKADYFEDGIMTSSEANDTVTFTFKGKSIGFYCLNGPDGNEFKYSIDNGAIMGDVDTYSAGEVPFVSHDIHGLEDKEHTVTITTYTPDNDGGNRVRLGYFLVD